LEEEPSRLPMDAPRVPIFPASEPNTVVQGKEKMRGSLWPGPDPAGIFVG